MSWSIQYTACFLNMQTFCMEADQNSIFMMLLLVTVLALESMKNNIRYILLLVHYWFPVVLGWSIAIVIHNATGMPFLSSGLYLYLLGICATYNLDRLLDNKDPFRPRWLTVALVFGFSVSFLFGLLLSINISAQSFSALLLFSIFALFYFQLKKIPFIKTILISVVWVWAGIGLPFANPHWFAWQFWTMKISVPLVMLVACGCLLCDIKDIRSDSDDGVRSLAVLLGQRKTLLVTSVLLIITAVISFYENRLGLMVGSAALILLAQFPTILSLEAAGPLIVDAALAIPGLLIVLHVIHG